VEMKAGRNNTEETQIGPQKPDYILILFTVVLVGFVIGLGVATEEKMISFDLSMILITIGVILLILSTVIYNYYKNLRRNKTK